MKRLLLCVLVCFSFLASAQQILNPKDLSLWNRGIVVFHSGDTLQCEMHFTRKVAEGLLQVLNHDKIEILTVKDVTSFSYYDMRKNKQRTFYSFALRADLSSRTHEVFIEHIFGNREFSILNHKALGLSVQPIQFNPFKKKKCVVNKNYIFDNKSGRVLPMSKENVLELMAAEKTQVLSYLQTSGIRLKTLSDFIGLLNYHQSLL